MDQKVRSYALVWVFGPACLPAVCFVVVGRMGWTGDGVARGCEAHASASLTFFLLLTLALSHTLLFPFVALSIMIQPVLAYQWCQSRGFSNVVGGQIQEY